MTALAVAGSTRRSTLTSYPHTQPRRRLAIAFRCFFPSFFLSLSFPPPHNLAPHYRHVHTQTHTRALRHSHLREGGAGSGNYAASMLNATAAAAVRGRTCTSKDPLWIFFFCGTGA